MMTARRPTPRLIQAFGCLRIGLHLLWGAVTVALIYPFVRESRKLGLKQRWSRQLLDILGVRLDAHLTGVAPGSLIVANHISWLDIYALNAARPMAFISKSEVRRWPLIGWLAANTDTVFLNRGSRRHAKAVNAQISGLLKADKDVAMFPEGTTTDGTHLLDFHGALLQPAVDTGRPVQPVALSYFDADGRRSQVPAYIGETSLGESIAAILACRSLTVRLRPTPALATPTRQRRELALAARGAIAYHLGISPAIDWPEPVRDLLGEQADGTVTVSADRPNPVTAG
jgi:1-acyl-sn-glycerol-3-phosphate acyltransferase